MSLSPDGGGGGDRKWTVASRDFHSFTHSLIHSFMLGFSGNDLNFLFFFSVGFTTKVFVEGKLRVMKSQSDGSSRPLGFSRGWIEQELIVACLAVS